LKLNLKQIQENIANGNTSCVTLVNEYLLKIAANKHLNCYIEVFADEALSLAKIVDEKIKRKEGGKLAGAIIGIKDVLCYKGHQSTASSKILESFESLYTATAIQKLLDEDAIIIGRLNCDEFAMGSSNENSVYGNVLNAADNNCVPGGSSGGSAVAVQAGLCWASLGTDTGGSVRQPASFCGIIGLKPSYGRISRSGVIAYASSFDQIGVFTNTVYDASILLSVMSGQDALDATTAKIEVPVFETQLENFDIKNSKIAYWDSCLGNGLDIEIKTKIVQWLNNAASLGASVTASHFDKLDYLIPCYYVLTTAEASSNLARYDGVHYGYRSPNATDLESVYKKTRSEGFGKEVQRRIMLGTFVLSEGYYDAYYAQAQRVRRMLTNEINKLFETVDFIVLPTTPTTAFKFGDKADPIAMYLNDIYTVLANLVGIPAISIPLGTHSNGMPYGLQILSKKFNEMQLLQIANWANNEA
jgi:aspartyl-tRNA(Asn)/glutamyl-tRNA(Gln) amidotransferase subunit A